MSAPRIPGVNGRLSIIILLSIALAAGCGGSGSSGPSASGDTAIVSVAQAPSFPAGTVATAAPAAAGGGGGGAEPFAANIDNVWITVQRIALVPDAMIAPGESRGPDLQGEQAVEDGGIDYAGLVSAAVVPPRTIDLLHLPPEALADILSEIKNIPAGKYGKIRLFYSDPKVHFIDALDNTEVKQTANYHIDIHFVGGGLVIPVRTSTSPDGGVVVHKVFIEFVLGKDGLKITVNPNKILMRPQVFATVKPVQMGISGEADNVVAGSLDIATPDGRSFHAVYGSIDWFFKTTDRFVPVDPALGIAALRDTAIVDVFGTFDSQLVLHADEIRIEFPATESGAVAAGWTDNSFLLTVGADNVVVFARPDRINAFYDNNVSFDILSDSAVVPGANVTARGYAVSGGIEAYWISIGP